MNATTLHAPRTHSKPADTAIIGLHLLCGLLAVLACTHARASAPMPAKLYEVTIETLMPHLEENLRNTITRDQHCLSRQDLPSAFPILRAAALKGCKLDHESRLEDSVSYVLICEGGQGTTGVARWYLGAQQIRGTLDVKLGGKNMTFSQRITAKPLGVCD